MKDKDGSNESAGLRQGVAEPEMLVAGRHQTEAELKEALEHYRMLVEVPSVAGEGIALLQDTEGVEAAVLYANDALVRLTGYTAAELVRTSWLALVSPRHRDAVAGRYRARMRGEVIPGIFEYTIITKAGRNTPIAITGGRLVHHGKPAAVIYVRDITERKQAVEKLRAQQELTGRILASTPNAVLVIDEGRQIRLANRAFYDMSLLQKAM